MTENEIKEFEISYTKFMNLNAFPNYSIEEYDLSINKIEEKGYAVGAQAVFENKKHFLRYPANIIVPPYLIYHEFTHILDADQLYNDNKVWNYCLAGYTEYHASQIELLFLLGAQSVKDSISFSMFQNIYPYSEPISVYYYINNKLNTAKDIITKNSNNFSDIKIGVDVLFNFWGLKSVCKMYASDFYDDFTYRPIVEKLSSYTFATVRNLMNGWLNDESVFNSAYLYSKLISELKIIL